MRQTFSKKEKLKSKKDVGVLFAEGKYLKAFPLKLIYVELPELDESIPYRVGVSVSKRLFKKAVNRNRIKRLIREAYRLNKQIIYKTESEKTYAMMFLYSSKDQPEYHTIETALLKLLNKFKISENLTKNE